MGINNQSMWQQGETFTQIQALLNRYQINNDDFQMFLRDRDVKLRVGYLDVDQFLTIGIELLQIIEQSMQSHDPTHIYDLYKAMIDKLNNFSYEINNSWRVKIIELISSEIEKCLQAHKGGFIPMEGFQPDSLMYTYKNSPYALYLYSYIELIRSLLQKARVQSLIGDVIELYEMKFHGSNYAKASVNICIAQFSQVNVSKYNLRFIIRILLQQLNSTFSRIVKGYSIYALIRLVRKFQWKLHLRQKRMLIPQLLIGVHDREEDLACEWLQLFNLLFQNYPETAEIQPICNPLMLAAERFIKQKSSIQIKTQSIQAFYTLSTIQDIVTQQRAQKIFQIYYNILCSYDPQKCIIIEKVYENMTGIVKNLKDSLQKFNYIKILSIQILRVQQKLSDQAFLACWINLCETGVWERNWRLYYKRVLKILETYSKKISIEENQISKTVLIFKSIKLTSELYKSAFSQFSLQTIQIMFQILEQNECYIVANVPRVEGSLSAINAVVQNSFVHSQAWYSLTRKIMDFYFQKLGGFIFTEAQIILTKCCLVSLKVLLADSNTNLDPKYLQRLVENLSSLQERLSIQKLSESRSFYFGEIGYLDTSSQEYIYTSISQLRFIEKGPLDDCRMVLPEVWKIIFSVVADQVALYQLILPQINLIPSGSIPDIWNMKQEMSYMCVLLQVLPYETTQSKFNDFLNLMSKYSSCPSSSLRQTIAEGVGIMVEKISLEQVTDSLVYSWKTILSQCFLTKKSFKQQDLDYDSCHTSCISSMGKIILKCEKYHQIKNLYQQWLQKLSSLHITQKNYAQIHILSQVLIKYCQKFEQPEQDHKNLLEGIGKILRLMVRTKTKVQKQKNGSNFKNTMRLMKKTINIALKYQIQAQNKNQICSLLSHGF